MPNFVRACFCISHLLQVNECLNLLRALEQNKCRYAADASAQVGGGYVAGDSFDDIDKTVLDNLPTDDKPQQLAQWLATTHALSIPFRWDVSGTDYEATVIRMTQGRQVRISFGVDDRLFLPAPNIQGVLGSTDDPLFAAFKQILVEIISHVRPDIAAIDEEADLMCNTLDDCGSLASWGNYFSVSVLSRWSAADRAELPQIVDEYIDVAGNGVLTFIHPLMANRAWSVKHERLEGLVRRNAGANVGLS